VPDSPRQRNGVDDAVLRVTIELLATMSFARLSMELVAKRAAVGKPTVYRRWPSKAALVADAVARFAPTLTSTLRATPLRARGEGWSVSRAPWWSRESRMCSTACWAKRCPMRISRDPTGALFPARQQVIEAALRRCVAAGTLPADLDLASAISLLLGRCCTMDRHPEPGPTNAR